MHRDDDRANNGPEPYQAADVDAERYFNMNKSISAFSNPEWCHWKCGEEGIQDGLWTPSIHRVYRMPPMWLNSWGKSEAMIEGYSQARKIGDIKDSMDRVDPLQRKFSTEEQCHNVLNLQICQQAWDETLALLGLSVGCQLPLNQLSWSKIKQTLAKSKKILAYQKLIL